MQRKHSWKCAGQPYNWIAAIIILSIWLLLAAGAVVLVAANIPGRKISATTTPSGSG